MQAKNVLSRMLLGAAMITVPGLLHAQYPSKPVRWILPYAPGGATTIVARIVAQGMSESLGQQIILENRGGGASVTGSNVVARSAPDGYTMLFGAFGFALTPSLHKNLPYDIERDFAPVSRIGNGLLALVVHPSLPAKSVKELIALAKAKPNQINYGSTGGGSSSSMGALLFQSLTGVQMSSINYKGAGPSTVALLSGEVSLIFSSILPALPHIKSGKVRVLGVSTPERSRVLPDVPTIAEAGVPGYDLISWYGALVPSGTPQTAIAKLNQAVRSAVGNKDIQQKLLAQGVDPAASSPKELGRYLKAEVAKWSDLLKKAGSRN